MKPFGHVRLATPIRRTGCANLNSIPIRFANAPFFLFLVLGLTTSIVARPEIEQSEKAKTNVLILFADDLGSGDLGMHGGISRTPNIDRFATEGVELKRYYGYPLCSPSRAALLTGQMPRRYGITHALGPRDPGLPADLPTLPRTLQSFGYQTWLVGKWHLGTASPPLQSGFDHFYGFEGPEVDYYKHTNRRGDVDWQRNGQIVNEPGYSTFLIANEAVRLIDQRDTKQPFYLQVAFNAPLRSGKGSVYEGGIRVPCMMRWPGQLERGTSSQQATSAQDLYPTIATAIGVSLEANQKLDGRSVWAALRNANAQDNGPFLIAGSDMALFDGDWKLIQTSDGRMSLFNLKSDSREATNMWSQNIEVGQRMQKLLQETVKEFPNLSQSRGPGPAQRRGR